MAGAEGDRDGSAQTVDPHFGQTLSELLTTVTAKAPKAGNTGTGPCDVFSPE